MKTRPLILLPTALWIALTPWLSSQPADPSSIPPPSSPPAPDTSPTPTEELLNLLGQQAVVQQMKDQIRYAQLQAIQQNGIPLQDNPHITPYLEQLDRFMSNQLNWQTVKPDFIRLYDSVFSPDEIQGLIDFYRSPLGKKILGKMPELVQQTSQLTHQRAQLITPDVQKMTQEFIAARQSAPAQPSDDPPLPDPVESAPAPPTQPSTPPSDNPPDLQLNL